MTDEITLDAPETRLERFLAAAAGMDGITLDEPVTRIEKYLYKIAQGSGGVPAVEDADKGKYLHANESTGDLEWATAGGGSGGGVLVVHEVDGALDKTYKQIVDALHANGVILEWTHEDGSIEVYLVIDYGNVNNVYLITFHSDSATSSAGGESHYYVAESENSYPTNDD